MKVSCEIIEDLLPLYHDGVCSADSRKLVEAHLKECEKCGSVQKALAEEEVTEHIENEKKALEGIKRNVFERVTGALMLGALLTMAAIVMIMGIRNLTWEQKCRQFFQEVIVPMEPEELYHYREGTKYERPGLVTERIEGVPEYRTDVSYRKYVDGYELTVSDLMDHGELMAILSVRPKAPLTHYPWDDANMPPELETLYLDILYLRKGGIQEGYHVYMQDSQTQLYAVFRVNRNLELMDQEHLSVSEIQSRQTLLETYRSELEGMLAAAHKTWPFLTE